jgi:beta-N-acetylhexosaminidase
MELRQAAGSLMVVGLGGTELTGLERACLRLVRPAGIILFRRNIDSPGQTRELLNEAAALCAPPALRCVDLEGGTVDRLRDALAPMPSAQAVARAAKSAGKPSLVHQHGQLIARAVKAFGFNTTLAPVLDLGLPISAKVMGTRTAAESAAEVAAYARPFLAALAEAGVAGCGKHFPGLGGGTLDSHLATPSIDRTGSVLWQQDLVPYRELRGELPMVMVSHAAYPRTPGKDTPASVSRYWIEAVLRKRIGYKGLVFSDDLEMGGILNVMPMEEAAIAAVRAGMDLIEICHSPELILRAFEALLREAERSRAFRTLLLARARRTQKERARLFSAKPAAALSSTQLDALRSRIQRFSERIGSLQPTEAHTA